MSFERRLAFGDLEAPVILEKIRQLETGNREHVGLGRIARREAADLCSLSPFQARHLLRRLEGKGRLRLKGQKRGAFYEAADTNKPEMDAK